MPTAPARTPIDGPTDPLGPDNSGFCSADEPLDAQHVVCAGNVVLLGDRGLAQILDLDDPGILLACPAADSCLIAMVPMGQ
jgi:hypothetical protein